MPSCVLAYSGGLDTSVILGWLQEEGYQVHAVYVDLGQPGEDREAILQKARDQGAISARLVDAQEELCRDYAFPVMQWQAKYEGIYLLGTSIARPLISKVCLQVAREVGAGSFAHGATGRGTTSSDRTSGSNSSARKRGSRLTSLANSGSLVCATRPFRLPGPISRR